MTYNQKQPLNIRDRLSPQFSDEIYVPLCKGSWMNNEVFDLRWKQRFKMWNFEKEFRSSTDEIAQADTLVLRP